MRRIRGALTFIIAILLIFIQLYYLIIDPYRNSTRPTITTRQYWSLAIPVFLISTLFLLMISWIGYTMAITKEPIRIGYQQAYEEAAGDLAAGSKINSGPK